MAAGLAKGNPPIIRNALSKVVLHGCTMLGRVAGRAASRVRRAHADTVPDAEDRGAAGLPGLPSPPRPSSRRIDRGRLARGGGRAPQAAQGADLAPLPV